MSGKSATTTVVGVRLPNEIVEIYKRRSAANNMTLSDYLRKGIIYDATRKHTRRTSENERDNESIGDSSIPST